MWPRRRATGAAAWLAAAALAGCACGGAEPPPQPPTSGRDAGRRADAWRAPCVTLAARPEIQIDPIRTVDVIVTVDNSGSMVDEIARVRAGINILSTALETSGLDYRVTMLSSRGDTEDTQICVPAPLGSGPPECGAGPEGRLRHVDVYVDSNAASSTVLWGYGLFYDFLRPGSMRVFLWITDDEGYIAATDMRRMLAALDPDTVSRSVHHAIVGYYGEGTSTDWNRPSGVCDSIGGVGETYLRLALCLDELDRPVPDCHVGTATQICRPTWGDVFDAIAHRTAELAIGDPRACRLSLPASGPEGRPLELSRIVVTYRDGVTDTVLPHSTAVSGCEGWQFDDEARPTAIVLCNDQCLEVQSNPRAEIEIAVPCVEDPS
jgi:hypothetical protein